MSSSKEIGEEPGEECTREPRALRQFMRFGQQFFHDEEKQHGGTKRHVTSANVCCETPSKGSPQARAPRVNMPVTPAMIPMMLFAREREALPSVEPTDKPSFSTKSRSPMVSCVRTV